MNYLVRTVLITRNNGDIFKYEIFLGDSSANDLVTVREGEGQVVEFKYDETESVFKVTQIKYDLQPIHDKYRLKDGCISISGGPVNLQKIVNYLVNNN